VAKINEEMKRIVSEQRLGYMATICEDGTPNLSPKGLTFVLDDDRLVVGEVRSPQTISNLSTQPIAEINVVDPIARKGFRFKGSCEVHSRGDTFEEILRFLRSQGAESRINSVIVMTVKRALPIVSPIYDSGVQELEVRKRWKQRFDELADNTSGDA